MSNYKRMYVPGGCYFFTLVTYQRNPVFSEEANIRALRNAFSKVRSNKPFKLDAIVVLPDHLHCLMRLPDGDMDYSSRWREIKKSVTRTLTQAQGTPVWQRRFWEHLVRDEDDWRRHMDYIHYNPVKHGLVERPADWRWSSFRKMVQRGWYDLDWGSAEPNPIAGMDFE